VNESWALSGDLARPYVVLGCVLVTASFLLLVLELRGAAVRARRGAVFVSGAVALSALLLAVLRPVRVIERTASAGARLVVLFDASRSIDLPSDLPGKTRRDRMGKAFEALGKQFAQVRVHNVVFGQGPPQPLVLPQGQQRTAFKVAAQRSSDLSAALEAIAGGTDELPQALVVVSDGRLDRPGEKQTALQLKRALGDIKLPLHTVSLSSTEPKDAAVRAVRMAEAVVAHQPAALTVDIACTGGLKCSEITVVARELHLEQSPVVRGSGTARLVNGEATVDLDITLDRAGQRILEVFIQAPEGDEIAANNRRFLTVEVARDRVRLLHVAGRPTYDVRALRTWLKSDASVDVVAFFILRTLTDDVAASADELALIPFPVDELFTKHLPSFDAVILQDFDAQPYGLAKHLPKLAHYVRQGGGLIMVGGPNAFVSGSYANTALARVLPVSLRHIPLDNAIDPASFVPRVTTAGRHAPVLEPLRSLLGERLPEMPGTNLVGAAREGATVLLEHPGQLTKSGSAMPVLALGEYGSGRTIALTVDGAHRLLFSTFALSAAGRAHGAFWDALLGWLMRDPRFEPAKIALPEGCIAGEPTAMSLRVMFAEAGAVAEVVVARMGTGQVLRKLEVTLGEAGVAVPVKVGQLEAGGYTATVRLKGKGRSAPSRYDFACEVGGAEWADARPDPARLKKIASATGGVAVGVDEISSIPPPKAARVIAERRVQPLLPPWGWALIAAISLGGHWLARRQSGLA